MAVGSSGGEEFRHLCWHPLGGFLWSGESKGVATLRRVVVCEEVEGLQTRFLFPMFVGRR